MKKFYFITILAFLTMSNTMYGMNPFTSAYQGIISIKEKSIGNLISLKNLYFSSPEKMKREKSHRRALASVEAMYESKADRKITKIKLAIAIEVIMTNHMDRIIELVKNDGSIKQINYEVKRTKQYIEDFKAPSRFQKNLFAQEHPESFSLIQEKLDSIDFNDLRKKLEQKAQEALRRSDIRRVNKRVNSIYKHSANSKLASKAIDSAVSFGLGWGGGKIASLSYLALKDLGKGERAIRCFTNIGINYLGSSVKKLVLMPNSSENIKNLATQILREKGIPFAAGKIVKTCLRSVSNKIIGR